MRKLKAMIERAVKSRLALVAFAGLALTGMLTIVDISATRVVVEVKGHGNEVTVTRNADLDVTAVDVCKKDATEVALVTNTVSGESHYAALYKDDDVRYDLTWQVSGDAIAIEALRGSETKLGVEKMSQEFATCINGKPVRRVSVSH
jgi:hypothetical protein